MGFDYIMIGAGTAGCILAARLSEDPVLCLVEAGRSTTDPHIAAPAEWPAPEGTGVDWRFENPLQAGTIGPRHARAHGRVIGGATAPDAMASVRGHPRAFDACAAANCAGRGDADPMPCFIGSETPDRTSPSRHGGRGPIRPMTPAEPHPVTRGCMAATRDRLGMAATNEHNEPRTIMPTSNCLTIVEGAHGAGADTYPTPVPGRTDLTQRAASRVDRARTIGAASGLANRREAEFLPRPEICMAGELPGFLARVATIHHHPVGTRRMGRTRQPSSAPTRNCAASRVFMPSMPRSRPAYRPVRSTPRWSRSPRGPETSCAASSRARPSTHA